MQKQGSNTNNSSSSSSNSNHSNNKSNRNHNRNCRYDGRVYAQLFTLIKFLTEIDVYVLCKCIHAIGLLRFCDLDLQFLIVMLIKSLLVLLLLPLPTRLPLSLQRHAKWPCVDVVQHRGRRILTYFDHISTASLIWIHEAIFIRYFYFFCFALDWEFFLFRFHCRGFTLSHPLSPAHTFFSVCFLGCSIPHNALCRLWKRGSCLRMQYLCSMCIRSMVFRC